MTTMAKTGLCGLPTELVQQIAGYACDGDAAKDATLPALRLTCKDLYVKTLELFTMYHSGRFSHAIFELSPLGLGTALWIVSNPYLRNKFESIEFRSKRVTDEKKPTWNDDDLILTPDGEDCTDNWFPVRDYWGQPASDCDASYMCSQTEEILRLEILEYERSPEMYHTLLLVFSELKKGDALSELIFSGAFDVVLQALEDAAFGRRIATVAVVQEHMLEGDWQREWNGVNGNTSFLRSVSIDAPDHGFRGLAPRPYPSFSSIINVTRTVDSVELFGCCSEPPFPRRRVCFGCQEMWKACFHRCKYPNLQSLAMYDLFVDGGHLKSFFKQNCRNLGSLSLADVKLTSGTWSSALKAFQGGPMGYLRLGNLYQKPAQGFREYGYAPDLPLFQCAEVATSRIQPLLDHMIDRPSYKPSGKYQKIMIPDDYVADVKRFAGRRYLERLGLEDWVP